MKVKAYSCIGLAFFLIAFIERIKSDEIERITLTPDDGTYVRYTNQGHYVSCRPGIATDDTIKWLRPGGSDVQSVESERVHVKNVNGTLRLVIQRVQQEDQGSWICILTSDERHQKSFTLHVYEPIQFEDAESVITVIEDHDATIYCEVTGKPEPIVHWYFNGLSLKDKIIDTHSGFKKLEDGLFIRNVNRNYAGSYTCKAFQIDDITTNVDERSIQLNVHYKPTISKHQKTIRYGFVDSEVNLTCEIEANPKPEFTWYRNGKKVTKDVFNDHENSILQVFIKSKDDYGEYKCKAKNLLGSKELKMTLIEGIRPEIPTKLALRGLSSDTFDVDVGAKRSSHPLKMDVNGFRFELIPKETFLKFNSWNGSWVKDFAVEDGATYLLNPLSENTTYFVRVASRNIAGFSHWTQMAEFSTLSKQPNMSNTAAVHSSINFLSKAFAFCSILKRQIYKL